MLGRSESPAIHKGELSPEMVFSAAIAGGTESEASEKGNKNLRLILANYRRGGFANS